MGGQLTGGKGVSQLKSDPAPQAESRGASHLAPCSLIIITSLHGVRSVRSAFRRVLGSADVRTSDQ